MSRKTYLIVDVNSSTPDRFFRLSGILEDLVCQIANKDTYHIKFQKIFIDINNHLYEIYLKMEDNKSSIYHIMAGFEEKIRKLKESINNPSVFTKMCVEFNFLSYDLVALFPNGVFNNQLILDDEAAENWWKKNFEDAIFLEPDQFLIQFSNQFPMLDDISVVLKKICFSQFEWNMNINKNRFNLFLRFFGGWGNLNDIWLDISNHPGNLYLRSLEVGIEEFKAILKRVSFIRTYEKTYVFFIDWTSSEGWWHLIYTDENQEIKMELMKINDLNKHIDNYQKFKYPAGLVVKKTSIGS